MRKRIPLGWPAVCLLTLGLASCGLFGAGSRHAADTQATDPPFEYTLFPDPDSQCEASFDDWNTEIPSLPDIADPLYDPEDVAEPFPDDSIPLNTTANQDFELAAAEGQRERVERREQDKRERDDPADLDRRREEFRDRWEAERARREQVHQDLVQRAANEVERLQRENSAGRTPHEPVIVIGGGVAGTAVSRDNGLILTRGNPWVERGDLPTGQQELRGLTQAGLPDPRTFVPNLQPNEPIPASGVVAAWEKSQADRGLRVITADVGAPTQAGDGSWNLNAGGVRLNASAIVLGSGLAPPRTLDGVADRERLIREGRLMSSDDVLSNHIPALGAGEKVLVVGNGPSAFQAVQVLLGGGNDATGGQNDRLGRDGTVEVLGPEAGFGRTLTNAPGLNNSRQPREGVTGDTRVTETNTQVPSVGSVTRRADGKVDVEIKKADGTTATRTYDRVVEGLGPDSSRQPPIIQQAAGTRPIRWKPLYDAATKRPMGVEVMFGDGKGGFVSSNIFLTGAAAVRVPEGAMDAAELRDWNNAWAELSRQAGSGNAPDTWNVTAPGAAKMRDYLRDRYAR